MGRCSSSTAISYNPSIQHTNHVVPFSQRNHTQFSLGVDIVYNLFGHLACALLSPLDKSCTSELGDLSSTS